MERRFFSLSDQIFEKLESDILSGKYERGALLTEMKLCEELSVSRTPVREALGRLKQEHLVAETGKGVVVLGITKEDLRDIMQVRLLLEGVTAARCAERIGEEQLEKLRETLELQEFYLQKRDSDRIKTMDSRFHDCIYLYSGSTVLFETLSPLHNKVQRYRKAALENTGRAEKSVAEHKRVLEAIAAHDPAAAEARMLEHIRNATASILK